jgi:hypothetical protein
MTDHIALLLCKMMVGHGRLALIWFCFSEYQKLCHVLSLAYVVRFEVESTHPVVETWGRCTVSAGTGFIVGIPEFINARLG